MVAQFSDGTIQIIEKEIKKAKDNWFNPEYDDCWMKRVELSGYGLTGSDNILKYCKMTCEEARNKCNLTEICELSLGLKYALAFGANLPNEVISYTLQLQES